MKTNTKLNPIANMAEVLTLAKADPKKPSKTISMLSPEKTLETIGFYAEGVKLGETSLDTMNKALAVFHEAKVKLCKASEKSSPLFTYSNQVRTMFVDTFKAQGKKPQYIEKQMYPAFLKAVNSGKPISQINASQEKAKGKKSGDKKQAGIDTLIAKVLGHEGFYSLPENLQYEIRDYLESEGYEITE